MRSSVWSLIQKHIGQATELFLPQQLLPHGLALYPRLVVRLGPLHINRRASRWLLRFFLLLCREPDYPLIVSPPVHHNTQERGPTYSTYPTSTTPSADSHSCRSPARADPLPQDCASGAPGYSA